MIHRLDRDHADEAASEVAQKDLHAPSDGGVDVASDPGPHPTISSTITIRVPIKPVLVLLSDHRRQLVRTFHSHLIRSTFDQLPSANI
jgi:hypothetical protein